MPQRIRNLILLLAGLAAAAAAFTLGRLVASQRGAGGEVGTELQNPADVRATELTRADGTEIALGEINPERLLVFFGFTNCPDVCPTTLARLGRAYRDAGEPGGTQVVFITVDSNDTPQQTQRYAQGFHPDFLGLSGGPQALARAAKAFFVGSRELAEGDFAHTDAVFLVEDGLLRRVVPQDQLAGIASLFM